MIAPVSFFFLWRHLCRYTSLSFFFGKKKRKKATNKKESLKFNQISLLHKQKIKTNPTNKSKFEIITIKSDIALINKVDKSEIKVYNISDNKNLAT